LKVVLFALFALTSFNVIAQVKTTFTPRYNGSINGDVTVIANNTISRTATTNYNGLDGNHDFTNNVYVDIDSDPTTFNSSNATLTNPAPLVNCLEIERVLLYWVAGDKGLISNGVEADNQPSWNFNDVKIQLPGQSTYTTVTADEVIFRGRDENPHFEFDPYVCFKDITTQVNALASPFGTYQVANVEGREGFLINHNSNGNTGTSGGWQIIIVYKSPDLNLRNITLFDGYANVSEAINNFDVNFSGFQTVPNGEVKSKIVIGALEGDRDLIGDKLQIQAVNNVYTDISTPLRPADNFFNSSIDINDTTFIDRVPASTNTLGFDASVFTLDNNGNSLIDNNQTSAVFRMTSAGETYGLYSLGFSIEVFEPRLDILLTATPNTLSPGQNATSVNFSIDASNTGNDNAQNIVLTTTLDPAITLVEPIQNLPTGVTYAFDPTTQLLTFNIGNNALPTDGSGLDIDFETQVQDNCYFLENGCTGSVPIQFDVNFTGEINLNPQSTTSSQGLDPLCNVVDNMPTVITLNNPAPATWTNAPGSLDVSVACSDPTALANAQALEPVPSCDGLTPIKTTGAFVASNTCSSNGTYTNTWTFTDQCGNTIDEYVQTITVEDSTPPDLTNCNLINQTIECALSENEANIVDWNLTNISILEGCSVNNCSNTNVTVTSNFVLSNFVDSCGSTGSITVTYTVEDDCGNTTTTQATFTIIDTISPDLSNCVIPTLETIECGDSNINQSNAALWNNEYYYLCSNIKFCRYYSSYFCRNFTGQYYSRFQCYSSRRNINRYRCMW